MREGNPKILSSATRNKSRQIDHSADDEGEIFLENRTGASQLEFESSSFGLQMRQVNEDVRTLKRDFTETLRRLEPYLLELVSEMKVYRSDITDIKIKLAALPNKTTLWGIGLAFITLWVTIASPKEFWEFLTEIAKHWNQH